MDSLNVKAFGGLLVLILVMATLLFIPAWTLHYWQAWVFLSVYSVSSLAITLYLMIRDRRLLQRRMSGGPATEKQPAQRVIMSFASLAYIGLIVVPALDHRLAWSRMPAVVSVIGDVFVALGFLAVFFVFKENTFSSATIEATSDQRVISTGPYAMIRHPMYAGGLILLLGIPIALGSWWDLLLFGAVLPAIIWRLMDEERFLARNLSGYAEYQTIVRHRLIPLVW
jgi:protein-S-isoprenylcysteine O-methyltransferase Ste14